MVIIRKISEMMKRIIGIGAMLFSLWACDPQDNFIDTGLSKTHDCSIYEYLHTSSYNWDSTILLIRRADLVELFEGKDDRYPQITFFGMTNHSIRRYLLEKNIARVMDLDAAFCRELLLKHLVGRRVMSADIDFRIPDIGGEIKGGTKLTCMGGNVLLLYREQDDYAGVENAGAIHLRMYSVTLDVKVPMASPDIDLMNGAVHALNYNYALGKI